MNVNNVAGHHFKILSHVHNIKPYWVISIIIPVIYVNQYEHTKKMFSSQTEIGKIMNEFVSYDNSISPVLGSTNRMILETNILIHYIRYVIHKCMLYTGVVVEHTMENFDSSKLTLFIKKFSDIVKVSCSEITIYLILN